jgi:ligand-binding sensor domain-containing protein
LLAALLTAGRGYSQGSKESGYPLIDNYSPKEYNTNSDNWAILQDERGMMYFGNSIGVLQFDGVSWRLYPVLNKSAIRSMAKGDSGKIYAGAQSDLGYLQPDASGKLQFHSLMKFIPPDKRDFTDVWQVYIVNGKVYFNASKYIFIWDIQSTEFKIIQSESTFHVMFMVRGSIYVREWGKGLEVLKDDSVTPLKGGEKFANERIYVMLPLPGKERANLIVTRTMGLFKYDGNDFIPFKTEADQFIKDNLIYFPGTILSDGNILLGTLNGGAVVIDTNGREVRRYSRGSGIISNPIYFTFQDNSGAIWFASDNGISRINYSSPVTYFDSRNNLLALPNYVVRHNGIIYAATNNGVYYLDPRTLDFHLLNNSNNQQQQYRQCCS